VRTAAIAGNERQFAKNLQPSRPEARIKPGLVPLGDSNQQALFVHATHPRSARGGDRVERDRGGFTARITTRWNCRWNSRGNGVPYAITSGLRFFEQAHVKDVAGVLKFAVNPRDEVRIQARWRVFLPGIGARSAEQLWRETKAARQRHSISKNFWPLKVPRKIPQIVEQLAIPSTKIAPGGKPGKPVKCSPV